MTNSNSVHIAVLASGSKGNCIAVFHKDRALLVDAGIAPKILGERCRALGMPLSLMPDDSPRKLDALLLTHWHTDHAQYATKLCVDYACPLICSKATFDALDPQPPKMRKANSGEAAALPDDSPFEVMPLAVEHDAEGARAFVIQAGSKTIVIAHDLGRPNPALLAACRSVDAVLIEANYDPKMLERCQHPAYDADLKARIASDKGHLSNQQAEEVLGACSHDRLQWVCALHVSQETNSPELVERAMRQLLPTHARLYIASQDTPLLLEVNGSPEIALAVPVDDHQHAVKINREVDSLVAQQIASDSETQRRRTRLGILFAEMRTLYEDNGAEELGLRDKSGNVCECFTDWFKDKVSELGISQKTGWLYLKQGRYLVPVVGKEAVENMTLNSGDSLALYAEIKRQVPQELIDFAQTHPAHEVKSEVFKRLYRGNGHFSHEEVLQIGAKHDQVRQIQALLKQIKELPEPPSRDEAEIIEYALQEFWDRLRAEPDNERILSLVPVEPPLVGDLVSDARLDES